MKCLKELLVYHGHGYIMTISTLRDTVSDMEDSTQGDEDGCRDEYQAGHGDREWEGTLLNTGHQYSSLPRDTSLK